MLTTVLVVLPLAPFAEPHVEFDYPAATVEDNPDRFTGSMLHQRVQQGKLPVNVVAPDLYHDITGRYPRRRPRATGRDRRDQCPPAQTPVGCASRFPP